MLRISAACERDVCCELCHRCADACASVPTCEAFDFGIPDTDRAGKCWHEHTSNFRCPEGFTNHDYHFYRMLKAIPPSPPTPPSPPAPPPLFDLDNYGSYEYSGYSYDALFETNTLRKFRRIKAVRTCQRTCMPVSI